MTDTLHKFLFDGDSGKASPVRGEIVALHTTWRQMIEHQRYPEPVIRMLGEMVAASALLSANLKFNGALIMQIHGDGPVRLMVVECNADLTMRATVKLDPDAQISADITLTELVNANGQGRFAVTLDPKDKRNGQQTYQGVVAFEGETVAEVLENYMHRSEQLDTSLWLAADGERAHGLLLQKLPLAGGHPEQHFHGEAEWAQLNEDAAETWNRAVTFANTLQSAELLATGPEELMRRLFWEETLRVFDPQPCTFRCTCSRERVARMLVSLGKDEIDDTVAEQGSVTVNCDFCNQTYKFDPVDCAQLFVTGNVADLTLNAGTILH